MQWPRVTVAFTFLQTARLTAEQADGSDEARRLVDQSATIDRKVVAPCGVSLAGFAADRQAVGPAGKHCFGDVSIEHVRLSVSAWRSRVQIGKGVATSLREGGLGSRRGDLHAGSPRSTPGSASMASWDRSPRG